MSVMPHEYRVAPDIVATAREFIRSAGDGCVVSISELLAELDDKFGDRFAMSMTTYQLVDLIEMLWADPHVEFPGAGWSSSSGTRGR